MSDERETRLFMISPKSMVTPDQLVRTVHSMAESVNVKETCYGCLVEGPKATVRGILSEIRQRHPYEIFSKVRAYPAGDPRRCRAQHGTRPGYAQLEAEWEALPLIGYALEHSGEGYREAPSQEPLPVERFKKICEASR